MQPLKDAKGTKQPVKVGFGDESLDGDEDIESDFACDAEEEEDHKNPTSPEI